jgi:hypothetical protein
MAPGEISRFLLRKQGLVIPEIILKQDFIIEFDHKLQEKSPILIALFFKKVADDIDQYIATEKINEVTKTIAELESEFSSHWGSLLTKEDETILYFVTQTQKIQYMTF